MAYATKDNLLTGDIPLAGKYGDGTAFVDFAADEIDAQIGHIYVTPVGYVNPVDPKSKPAQLLLKKINILLASGRIILDMAAGTEDDNLHAYGNSMLREGINLLNKISSGQIKLYGAITIVTDGLEDNTAVSITQEDPESLVESFYTTMQEPAWGWPRKAVAQPYGGSSVTDPTVI